MAGFGGESGPLIESNLVIWQVSIRLDERLDIGGANPGGDMSEAERSKFIWLTGLLMIVFVVLAFGLASWAQPFRLHRYVKPLVVVHILASLGWLVLFFSQSGLVHRGEIEKHRQRLTLATALVVVSFFSSIVITYQWGNASRFVAESRDAMAFAILFAAAIAVAKRGDFEAHKRLMLIAGLNLIHPAHVRVPNIFDLPPAMSLPLTLTSWIVIPLAYDWVTQRKIHKVTLLGMGFTIVSCIIVVAVVFSPLMPMIETSLYGEGGNFGPSG